MANRGVRSWTALSLGAMLACATPLAAEGQGQTAGLMLPQGSQTVPTTPPAGGQTSAMAAQGGPVLQLTMEQAVAMAVETNLGLKAQRLNVVIAAEGVAGAQAAFKPILGASTSTGSSTRLPTSFTDLTSGSISSSSASGTLNVQQALPWYGGVYFAQWTNGRSTTTQPSPTFNPQLNSNVQFQYSQPLLRGFSIDSNRAALENSQTQQQVADLDIQLQTITLQNQVRQAYLSLKAANASLGVSKTNLDVAKRQLSDSQAKVKVGVSAQVDIISTQVQVEVNQQSVIQAEGSLAAAEDQLRSLILDPNRPDYWTVHLDATDPIVVQPREIDVEAAVKTALATRLDLQEQRRNLEVSQRNVRLNESLTKPQLNAVAQYSALSSGGTQFSYDSTGSQIGSPAVKNYGSVLGEAFGGSFPSWSVGANFSYPIGRSAAEANLAQQRLFEQQAEINIHNSEVQVAAQVRQAARDIKTLFQVVQAAHAALDAAQKQLDAENRKQDVGLSDTFTVILKTQALSQAAVGAVNAEINYNFALLTFDRLQKVR
jgi:outer membrane protein TolC